jgi:hypothetical protein
LLIRLMVDLASKADFGWTQWLYHFDWSPFTLV